MSLLKDPQGIVVKDIEGSTLHGGKIAAGTQIVVPVLGTAQLDPNAPVGSLALRQNILYVKLSTGWAQLAFSV